MAKSIGKRRPGRPAGDQSEAVKQRLLEAARELCIEVGFDAASTKAIAERAGVNPAMINYYFGGKEGLTQAMMRAAMAPLIAQLDAAERAGATKSITLEQFMRGYMHAIAAIPWLPQLVIREVLPANGRFRELFVTELGGRAGKLLPGLLAREREAGRLRADLDPELATLSFASLAIFPFLAAPIAHAVLGLDMLDPATVERVIEHALAVLRDGLGADANMEGGPR